MNKKEAKKLFDKYLKNECSAQEKELLHRFLNSYQGENQFWAEFNYEEKIRDKIWHNINSEINAKKTKKTSFNRYFKYAAIFVGLIGLFLLYQVQDDTKVNSKPMVADSAIILKTSDNVTTTINTKEEKKVIDKSGKIIGTQRGAKISYSENAQIRELIYNEIWVPNGKKFQLVLSDGTLVHINSGSSLKYPVNFLPNTEREVFLKGEAYFEAAKDSARPFVVVTKDMGVEVLGTRFGVNSYEGSETFAVLAEGSVVVFEKTKKGSKASKIIEPREKATLTNTEIAVDTIDLEDYLGWINGRLTFNNERFIDIVHKIERHYAVQIQNEYIALNPERFKGTFKGETINDLMDTFKESAGFKYEIKNQKIVIMK